MISSLWSLVGNPPHPPPEVISMQAHYSAKEVISMRLLHPAREIIIMQASASVDIMSNVFH